MNGQVRSQKGEVRRLQEAVREKQTEGERLRWEIEQTNDRDASRKKVTMLEDEVRAFKTSAASKLQQMEMSQLREREAAPRL